MRIRKILQKIFKKSFHLIFKVFYGKINISRNLKTINFEKIEVKNLKIDKKNFNLNNNIYIIPEGRIFTDLNEHVAVIKDNLIIPEISFQQIKNELKNVEHNRVIQKGTNRLQKKFDGRVFSLVQGGSGNNYFHFLFDIVTKLKIYEERFSLSDIDYFYVPGINSWQKQILSLFKIDEKKLIDSNKYRHIKAREIIAIDHPWYKSGYIQKEIKKLPEWSIFFLREKFLDLRKKFQTSKKIFIDRTDSLYKHCKLINNQEVIEFLEKKGFKSYQTSKLDFYEQIYLFENAEIIISPHGAALTNIIFSKPGMRLFELIPKNHGSVKCERISSFLKFNYTRVDLDPLVTDNNEGDIKIELDQLERILK
tara:strand:- start:7031 stop:8125 length:1095 start_codon:yes stop_codon:yes gene_type:complete